MKDLDISRDWIITDELKELAVKLGFPKEKIESSTLADLQRTLREYKRCNVYVIAKMDNRLGLTFWYSNLHQVNMKPESDKYMYLSYETALEEALKEAMEFLLAKEFDELLQD